MNNEIVAIELVFENCENVKFDINCVKSILLDNITEKIIGNDTNGIQKYRYVENVFILINSEANKIEHFEISFDDERSLFTRILRSNDITRLNINYRNGYKEDLYVHWDENIEYTNSYQKSKLDKHTGDLQLVIGKHLVI